MSKRAHLTIEDQDTSSFRFLQGRAPAPLQPRVIELLSQHRDFLPDCPIHAINDILKSPPTAPVRCRFDNLVIMTPDSLGDFQALKVICGGLYIVRVRDPLTNVLEPGPLPLCNKCPIRQAGSRGYLLVI